MFRLALVSNQRAVQLSEIARLENLSEKYLGQIVIQLKNRGLVQSVRGALGGYHLSREASQITAREVIEALEGTLDLLDGREKGPGFVTGDGIIDRLWEMLALRIRETLEEVTLRDLENWYRKDNHAISYEI
jgi:Rrf2 family protein